MRDYGRKPTFASFLPGIAGIKGTPIWCYYVNRGQGVVSFGVDNKDYEIMEFYPAHVAYQNVKRTGFRTFIRRNGEVFEAFSNEELGQDMTIEMNALRICEDNKEKGLKTEVLYYTLPEERLGALVRNVKITNTGNEPVSLEVLDGMPAVVCYGVSMDNLKNMTQTAKAWMQVEDASTGAGYYRVRASIKDSTTVTEVKGGNFAVAFDVMGNRLQLIADPDTIFSYDTSFGKPVVFSQGGLEAVNAAVANSSNLFPCAFFGHSAKLEPGESTEFFELIGQVDRKELYQSFLEKKLDGEYFLGKYRRAVELVDELCSGIETKTGNQTFDSYCSYTFMDNTLRGGYPIKLGKDKIFYVYSRKHGDLERDYNYFAMSPEFFSQGNGNFRDINQNRRCDTFFAPFVERENIHTFFCLIQLDGYNPLGVERLTYSVPEASVDALLEGIVDSLPKKDGVKCLDRIGAMITGAYTPGQLYQLLMDCLPEAEVSSVFEKIIDASESLVNGNFGEGYWTDHWTYNLDLIEEYLAVFPEKEKEMLYEKAYTYFLSQINVNPRFKRYENTENGIRQYHALNLESQRTTEDKLVRGDYGKGQIVRVTLMEKLVLLCTLKFATLDSRGMGIEMEGGKPGWYDALNGMPALLGSSMAETYELARILAYTIGALERFPEKVELSVDLAELLEKLGQFNLEFLSSKSEDDMLFWNKINDAKESYREKTFEGISGETTFVESKAIVKLLQGFLDKVNLGIKRAIKMGDGICPTYFTYQVTDFKESDKGIKPKKMEPELIPYFLEGPVRYLKLDRSSKEKKALYKRVKASDLYDSKLSMYKVNASLSDGSYELGRAKAFTPGWLENESIWLHMEYKYLLEVLNSGLYQEFAEDFKAACIPFLNEEEYGRSILENSSFIASSKNPNEKLRGKGFVARLSGSTIEFISMWKHMMFGAKPFSVQDGELICSFEPVIPEYLIGDDCRISARFLGQALVSYSFSRKAAAYPGSYRINRLELIYEDGKTIKLATSELRGDVAIDIRAGRVKAINIEIEN